jgi:hypothetical protein
MSAFPDLSLGLSTQLTSGANGNWFGTSPGMPISFDHSGWNVGLHSSGNQSATGSTGQGSGAGSAAPSGGGLLGSIPPQWLILAAIAYLLLRNK